MNKLFILVMVFLAVSIPALAYLDPGTGSYLFQLLIAGIDGAGYAVKVFWKNISDFVKTFFAKLKKKD